MRAGGGRGEGLLKSRCRFELRTCELVVASAADDPAAATRRRRRDARDGSSDRRRHDALVGDSASLVPRSSRSSTRPARGRGVPPRAPRRGAMTAPASMATLAERLSALAPPDADARASASPARPDQSALFDVLAELARATRGSSSDEVKASQRLVEDALLRVTCGGWAGPAVRRAAADVLARLFLAGNPVSLYSCLNHLAAAVRGDDPRRRCAGEDLLPGGHHPPRRSLPRGRASVGRGGVPRAPRGVASVARRRDERIRARPRERRRRPRRRRARLRRRHLQTPRRGRGATRRRQVRNEARREGPPRRRDPPRGRRDGRVRARSAARRGNPPGRREGRRGDARGSRRLGTRPREPALGFGFARAPVQHDRRPDRRVRVRVGARGRAGGVQGVDGPAGDVGGGSQGRGARRLGAGRLGAGRLGARTRVPAIDPERERGHRARVVARPVPRGRGRGRARAPRPTPWASSPRRASRRSWRRRTNRTNRAAGAGTRGTRGSAAARRPRSGSLDPDPDRADPGRLACSGRCSGGPGRAVDRTVGT